MRSLLFFLERAEVKIQPLVYSAAERIPVGGKSYTVSYVFICMGDCHILC